MLSFIFGGSGSGKTTALIDIIIRESLQHPDRNYLVLVPDQFTMETQRLLVLRHPNGGIMNIDVLSFGRLCYRLFEEAGGDKRPVLDDTGKNLILRIVADRNKEKLPVLGGHLKKQGYIHQIKSVISEFMQYGVGPEELEKMLEYSKGRGALHGKMQDLAFLYGAFEDYIRDHYLTREETVQVAAKLVSRSAKLKNCVIAMDGFTGFTPVQMQLIEELLRASSQMWVTLLMDGDPNKKREPQDLFALSYRTLDKLERTAERARVLRGKDILLSEKPVKRLGNFPALAHLEQQLFRYPVRPYGEEPEGLSLRVYNTPAEEALDVARRVHRLVREEGYYYRDIALVCGNLDRYQSSLREAFTRLNVPFFLDRNRGLIQNPVVEFIAAGLQLYEDNFTAEAVNRLLRTGLTDFTFEEIDMLDNFLRETGIKGYSKWKKPFLKTTKETDPTVISALRERLLAATEMLQAPGQSCGERVTAVRLFLETNRISEKLTALAEQFKTQGDGLREMEYSQVYDRIGDVLTEIETISGQERVDWQEFRKLLEAGFSELQIGLLPVGQDYVTVGDMERTRLSDVKVLFFLGVNDGSIPSAGDAAGLLSEPDRDFLAGADVDLSPSPREKMYTQRTYLYMNLTKPSEKLFISLSGTDEQGKSLRESYLIRMLTDLFPKLAKEYITEEGDLSDSEGWQDGYEYLALQLQRLASGALGAPRREAFLEELSLFAGQEETAAQTRQLIENAFLQYEDRPLPEKLARELLGEVLRGSVTRFETFASCAYQHFLKYEVGLSERPEYGTSSADSGQLLHNVLQAFSAAIREKGWTWGTFPLEEAGEILRDLTERESATLGQGAFYENARTLYMRDRLLRVLLRTVSVIQSQVKAGVFEPTYFETEYLHREELGENLALLLQARVDRIDTAADEFGNRYLRIIDYKSSGKDLNVAKMLDGLQLQLAVYLHYVLLEEREKHPEEAVLPAGMLYYQLEDKLLEIKKETDPAEMREEMERLYRMSGAFTDDLRVLRMMENVGQGKLKTLDATLKDGLDKANHALSEVALEGLSEMAVEKCRELARRIYRGEISASPAAENERTSSCGYCPYRSICGFDLRIPGYKKRRPAGGNTQEDWDALEEAARQIMTGEGPAAEEP